MLRTRSLVTTLFMFAATLVTLAAVAPMALARPAPLPPDDPSLPTAPVIAPIIAQAPPAPATHNSSVWIGFVLVAVATAVVTATVTLLAVRRLRTPRPVSVTA